MTDGPGRSAQAWSAVERDARSGQRDYRADAREAVADARDASADERDDLADAREEELGERETRLGEREAALTARGAAAVRTPQERDHARALREKAKAERERLRADRAAAADAREQARQRRTGRAPAGLAAVPGDGAAGDERVWGAERRDFIADWRDYIADARDAAADARDAVADERDHLADIWEAELDEREASLDGSGPGVPAARASAERARARALREEARTGRERYRADRNAAVVSRNQATRLRSDGTPATGLAMAFTEIARHLYDAGNLDEVLTRIAGVCASAVPGCEMASITVRSGGAYRTVTSTHQAATAADKAQYEAKQGPCLSAIDEGVLYAPAFPDSRWPKLGSRPADAGVHSVVSYSLATSGPASETVLAGSLNAYAATPRAFGDEAREIGLILAAHASIAAHAAGERSALEQLNTQLQAALASRDVIGQAKGILMERLKITPEDAFDTLRRSSQSLNLKLREVAQQLADTGQLEGGLEG